MTIGLYGPVTVLLPHPDDEFAVFPWLSLAIKQGLQVRCIWVTDGGFGGQDPRRRESESRSVLRRLKLDEVRMDFFGARHRVKDGELHLHAPEVLELLKQDTNENCGGSIIFPALEGGHQDHDATHIIGRMLAHRMRAAGFEYSVYNGYKLPGPFFRVFHPLNKREDALSCSVAFKDRIRFVQACFSYRSQWKSFVGLLPLFILRMMASRPYVLHRVDISSKIDRPHQGKLLFERRTSHRWSDIEQCMSGLEV